MIIYLTAQHTTHIVRSVMKLQSTHTPTGAGDSAAQNIYRASIDTKVVGHFPSMSAAMKVLSAAAIKSAFGYNGYVDVFDPNDEIMPGKGAEKDGYKCMRHRVVDGGRGNSGWFWND